MTKTLVTANLFFCFALLGSIVFGQEPMAPPTPPTPPINWYNGEGMDELMNEFNNNDTLPPIPSEWIWWDESWFEDIWIQESIDLNKID